MIKNDSLLQTLESPVRKIETKVELYNSSTLVQTFKSTDKIKSFEIEKKGEEGKFFGFGFCQKFHMMLIDINREVSIPSGSYVKVYFDDVLVGPDFYITKAIRDENTNNLSVTGYDKIYDTSVSKTGQITISAPYTVREYMEGCAALIGVPLVVQGVAETETCLDTSYPEGANLEGTETIRSVLNALAEVTQTVYFINAQNQLVFKRLDKDGAPVSTITKENYFTLKSGANKRLQTIANVTQLGDDVEAHITAIGSKQYVRDNPFWELRTDIGELLQKAVDFVGGISINQFQLTWRANPLLEPGDKIGLIDKDGTSVTSYLVNDVLRYEGSLEGFTQWKYVENDTATNENPNNLGEALNQTFARVDKVNKQVDIVVSDVQSNTADISGIKLNTSEINAAVQQVEKNVSGSIDSLNQTVDVLTQQVSTKMNSEQVNIEISKQLENGIDKVTTGTGFTFNEEGLNISKTNTDISTTITENGMKILKGNKEVLTANNQGVIATDLHADTYLIIGKNSRIEDFGPSRTAVFWIGG